MNNDELIAAGHELAKCLDSNTPLLDIAKLLSKMATQLDVTTAAMREKTKQCEQLAVENAALMESHKYVGPSPKYNEHAMMEMKRRFIDELIHSSEYYSVCGHISAAANRAIKAVHGDYSWLPQTPATDAFLREVRADAILFASYQLPDSGKYQDSIQALSQEIRDGDTQVSFPVKRLRQGGAA
ncbi:hypothetical protein AGJ00_000961 [Cronobacter sakazakii]|nr:hypothetical protein [Cronobacter sakazakii]